MRKRFLITYRDPDTDATRQASLSDLFSCSESVSGYDHDHNFVIIDSYLVLDCAEVEP